MFRAAFPWQVRLYAQRRLADALMHEAGCELDFAQLVTLKMLLVEQVDISGPDFPSLSSELQLRNSVTHSLSARFLSTDFSASAAAPAERVTETIGCRGSATVTSLSGVVPPSLLES